MKMILKIRKFVGDVEDKEHPFIAGTYEVKDQNISEIYEILQYRGKLVKVNDSWEFTPICAKNSVNQQEYFFRTFLTDKGFLKC